MTAAEPSTISPDESARSLVSRLVPWVARVSWLLVALAGGSSIEAAVDSRSGAVRWTTAVGAWSVFGAVAIALLVPAVISLTVARVGSPLAVVAAIVTAFAGSPAVDVGLMMAPAIVAVAAIFTAEFGGWMVQASAYGDEHRLLLRSPVPAGTAAAVAWVIWAAVVIAGPLCLAAQNWLAGVPITLVAAALTIVVGPRWHAMSRRWLVLVPAGLVVHDPVVLADTVMVRTDQLASIRLALADTEAADLTGPASGYAIQVDTRESVTTVFAFTPKEPNGRAIHMTGFLVAPSRPGDALRTAKRRGLPVV